MQEYCFRWECIANIKINYWLNRETYLESWQDFHIHVPKFLDFRQLESGFTLSLQQRGSFRNHSSMTYKQTFFIQKVFIGTSLLIRIWFDKSSWTYSLSEDTYIFRKPRYDHVEKMYAPRKFWNKETEGCIERFSRHSNRRSFYWFLEIVMYSTQLLWDPCGIHWYWKFIIISHIKHVLLLLLWSRTVNF